MIVKGECFFSGLIVDNNWPQYRICFKNCDKIKAKPAFEIARLCLTVTPYDIFLWRTANQFAVIQGSEWIPLGHACDLPILMVGRDEDVISLVERIKIGRAHV